MSAKAMSAGKAMSADLHTVYYPLDRHIMINFDMTGTF